MNTPRLRIAFVVVIALGAWLALFTLRSPGRPGDALERAWTEARRGRLDETESILQTEIPDRPLPSPEVEELRIRLIAARGNVRSALVEVVRSRRATSLGPAMVVLATLHETLEREGIDTRRSDGALARYALGFGPATDALDTVGTDTRAVLEALRNYETDKPVDTEALEAIAANSNELPRFIGLAQARSALAVPSR